MDLLPAQGLQGSREERPGLSVHRKHGVEREHVGERVPAAAAGGTKVPPPSARCTTLKVAVLTGHVGEQLQNAVSKLKLASSDKSPWTRPLS